MNETFYGFGLLGKSVRKKTHLTPMSPSPAIVESVTQNGSVHLKCPHCSQHVGTHATATLEPWPVTVDGEVKP